jgi:hypothetical protein
MVGSLTDRGVQLTAAMAQEDIMKSSRDELITTSRRNILKGSAALLVGGGIGSVMTNVVHSGAAATGSPADAPPLPWKWVTLDPLEAGRRAYRFYLTKGGCGTGSYLAPLSLLKEKVGYPWTTLPDMMMAHAAAGYGGHGTLCGALGGASCIINLVAYGEKNEVFRQMVDRLFYWYAEQEFPSDRFDDISAMPKQVKAKAMSPLCHTSVSKWARAAGDTVSSKAKKERCAKVCGEVVYIVTLALNEYFDGKWTPPVWKPSKQIEHCVQCHGPDDMWHTKTSMNHQQGHMECLMCHSDHTK